MNGKKLVPTVILSLLIVICVVIIIDYAFVRRNPREMTFGTLAAKEPGKQAGSVKVFNCVGGKQYGKFVVFHAVVRTNHTVVFVLDSDRPLGRTETVLTGHCEGIANFTIPGCPALPPFLLVTEARPVPH